MQKIKIKIKIKRERRGWGVLRTRQPPRIPSKWSIGSIEAEGLERECHVPQYQMTVWTPALVNSEYSVGILWYSVCAGRLMEPWMVPP